MQMTVPACPVLLFYLNPATSTGQSCSERALCGKSKLLKLQWKGDACHQNELGANKLNFYCH